jgi:hypothetical protein
MGSSFFAKRQVPDELKRLSAVLTHRFECACGFRVHALARARRTRAHARAVNRQVREFAQSRLQTQRTGARADFIAPLRAVVITSAPCSVAIDVTGSCARSR